MHNHYKGSSEQITVVQKLKKLRHLALSIGSQQKTAAWTREDEGRGYLQRGFIRNTGPSSKLIFRRVRNSTYSVKFRFRRLGKWSHDQGRPISVSFEQNTVILTLKMWSII